MNLGTKRRSLILKFLIFVKTVKIISTEQRIFRKMINYEGNIKLIGLSVSDS